ncbi:MAG: SseB family protein [Ruminococcus sp.]|uniref:SseB protein N-terminal domain-containing protein n=1 Tax=Ruminococcus albus TaxID=1264 RepID=A0A1H7GET4_RUMAL|nr:MULTISPECIES: SseB family protein [Ruminococcus]MBO4865507.1 SseB family protein [Ruminococcus sp.]SEK35362.1 SseB protein N-terminal domain-containing protein [Ruminococcus albus]
MAENLHISGTVTKEKIDNTALVEAINDMRKAFSADTQNKVINTALRSTFLVPAIIEKGQELVADQNNHVQFKDKQEAKFMLVNKPIRDEQGNQTGSVSFFPVFTDAEELKKLNTDQLYRPFAMKFSDIAYLTESTPNVEGFVINPFTKEHNLPFTKPMLESIKQTLINFKKTKDAAMAAAAEAEAQEAAEGEKPDITVSSSEEQ